VTSIIIVRGPCSILWGKGEGSSSNESNENLWILFIGTYHPTLADDPTSVE